MLRPGTGHSVHGCSSTQPLPLNLRISRPIRTIHPVLGRRLTARRIAILASGPNTDGFDPDSTSDVLFEDSYIANGDDMVAIKAGWDCAGYENGVPSDNILIRNVTQWGGGGGISLGCAQPPRPTCPAASATLRRAD